MRILVTGGAGYIGATAADILISQGFDVTVLDDCSTGHSDAVPANARFIQGSIMDRSTIAKALLECEAVMHFAGKSLVGESVLKPKLYWSVNVEGTANLLEEMRTAAIGKIVFSSSAATYGEPQSIPILESDPTLPTNPYGATKARIDEMLTEESINHGLSAISLRYFNVAGAHQSSRGWMPERHNPETHLIPNALRSTLDNPLQVFGSDWPTKDGTCVRDYVHVVDLIQAHIEALKTLTSEKHSIINIGSGSGYSVSEVIDAGSKVLGRVIPHIFTGRRDGDPAVLVADITKAYSVLKWKPTRDMHQMVLDSALSLELL